MLCGTNETLCPDGSCVSSSATCDGRDESPCEYECAPVACNKVDDFHDSCEELYGGLWDAESACGEQEVAETTHVFTYSEPGFVFFYVLFTASPLLLLLWCAYNQRISPVPGSCQTFELNVDSAASSTSKTRIAWQTGYKYHPVGIVLYTLTMMTMAGVYALLSWIVIQHYIQQEAIGIFRMKFEDELQVLFCFILVWMYGLIYLLFMMKFPHSVLSVHLRRCALQEANYVAVAVKRIAVKDTEITFSHETYLTKLKQYFASFYDFVHIVMTFVFSDMNTFGCERKGDATFSFRPVESDELGNKFITFEFRRYNLSNLNEQNPKFVPGAWSFGKSATIGDILALDNSQGLSEEELNLRRRVCGRNVIEMEKPSFLRTLKRTVSAPFYTYQMLMIFSWIPIFYYYMAFTWCFIVVTGAFVVSIFQYKNATNLYRLTQVSGQVNVIRSGKTVTLSQDQLVPGDILSVVPGVAYCDMVLVNTSRVLVDESALTGEAHPVGKVAFDASMAKEEFNEHSPNKRNTIFAGTSVIESDESSRAIVLKTASYTARGELIRDIFAYRRNLFKFDTEVPIVVAILFFYACFGWGFAYHWTGEDFEYGWFYGIYVVCGCLPPLLPTVFTVSVGISDDRLAKRRIACTNAESILVAGKVTRAFFDKTGTITKQGLNFVSARGKSSCIDESQDFSKKMPSSSRTGELELGMACCHNLTRSKAGELIGNPVDRVMFENTGAQLDNSSAEVTLESGKRVQIVHEFAFDQHRMTQSVLVRDDSGNLVAFCKGSGEAIRDRCINDTLPTNFDSLLRESAKSGLYQISMASKVMAKDTDVAKVTRDQVECDLNFEGVITFKNEMRENSPSIIRHLEDGEVNSIMISGDSVLTCITIAKESEMIKPNKLVYLGVVENGSLAWKSADTNKPVQLPPMEEMANIDLALSGAAWNLMQVSDPKNAAILRDYVRVVGRCTPHDKVAIVQYYSRAGEITLMCGDGGNDCGALKAAHVGVALSDAEASIVAPFTSLDKEIGSVIDVISEGRCALGSALASYKFVILYGQIETITQLVAAYNQITFGTFGWVFYDGVWTITLAFALPLARAAEKLAPSRPTASILGLHTMSSALGIMILDFLFLVIAYVALNHQDWYKCRQWKDADLSNVWTIGDNYETEVLWLITGFQLVISGIVFNFGYEFRQAWIRNYVLVMFVTIYVTVHFYVTLVPSKLSCFFRINCDNEDVFNGVIETLSVQNDFNTTIMPKSFRRILVGIMVANLVAVVGWDYLVVNGLRRYYGAKKRAEKKEKNLGKSTTNQETGEEFKDEEAMSPSK